jgi:hypothetical protein
MRIPPRIASILGEIIPVLVIIGAVLVALASISTNGWTDVLLYNGDSLVLPLLERSIQLGEPLDWVFSSQLFLFPEGLLYAVSSIFSDSIRVVLTINAVVNVLVIYVLLRWIARLINLNSRSRLVELIASAGATLVLVVLIVLEQNGPVVNSGLATPMLTTTFYVGVIMAGLFVIAMTLWLTRTFTAVPWERRRLVIYGVAVVVVAGLATFCNPLYILQVTVPLGMAVLFLVMAHRLSWRHFAFLALANAVPLAAGMLARQIFSFLSPTVLSNYVQIDNIPVAVRLYRNSVVELLSNGSGTAKLLVIVALAVTSFIVFAISLHSLARPALGARITTERMFFSAFVVVSVITLILGTVLSGSTVLRYTAPTLIFPLLTVVSLAVAGLPRLLSPSPAGRGTLARRVTAALVVAVGSASLIAGAASVPTVAHMDSGVDWATEDCFDSWIGDATVNGVGSYWTTRTLQIYGRESGDLLQVDFNLAPFAWMINLDAYTDKTFSYVVVDATHLLSAEALTPLGTPADVVECGNAYTIYDYRGTPGEQILTDRVATQLKEYQADH